MYRHLVNEIADLCLVIISDLTLVISGPLSSDFHKYARICSVWATGTSTHIHSHYDTHGSV